MQTRRQFLKLGTQTTLILPTAVVAGCLQSPKEPLPFETGEEVSPPLGCTELRQQNSVGDCT